jgi:hypothetical protein
MLATQSVSRRATVRSEVDAAGDVVDAGASNSM